MTPKVTVESLLGEYQALFAKHDKRTKEDYRRMVVICEELKALTMASQKKDAIFYQYNGGSLK